MFRFVFQTEEVGRKLAEVYQRLQDVDANVAEAEAGSILSGLGFSLKMQHRPIKELSGGWRVRVALARSLFATPDILCLDEPTNHLDLHAAAWLTDFLQNSPMTCIIVSHARTFLNDVCTDIIDFRDQVLVNRFERAAFNFSFYYSNLNTTAAISTLLSALKKKRNVCSNDNSMLNNLSETMCKNSSTGSVTKHPSTFFNCQAFHVLALVPCRAASVQSRIKALEKLPQLEAVANDPTLNFTFGVPENLPTPVLQLSGAWFSYLPSSAPEQEWILKNVDFSVDLQSRIAVSRTFVCE